MALPFFEQVFRKASMLGFYRVSAEPNSQVTILILTTVHSPHTIATAALTNLTSNAQW